MSGKQAGHHLSIRRTKDGDPFGFQVTVSVEFADDGRTEHQVTMSTATFTRLTTGYNTPENVVAAVFRFLLEREPRESILPRFDVADVSRYFPDFEAELPRHLPKTS